MPGLHLSLLFGMCALTRLAGLGLHLGIGLLMRRCDFAKTERAKGVLAWFLELIGKNCLGFGLPPPLPPPKKTLNPKP